MTNAELRASLLAYYTKQNQQYGPPKPVPPPELVRFEARFPGCSLGPFPWPGRKVVYRLEETMEPCNARISTPIDKMTLIATCGADTLAAWSVVGAHWKIVCGPGAPTVLDSPWSHP